MAKPGSNAQVKVAQIANIEPTGNPKNADKKSLAVLFLLKQTYQVVSQNWRSLGGVIAVYIIFYALLVNNLGNVNSTASTIKTQISLMSGVGDKLSHAFRGYSDIAGGSNMTQVSSLMQNLLFVLTSLAIIWSLRHLLAGQRVSVKQAYYSSMRPLIPFVLIILVLFLEILPMTLGSAILAAIMTNLFNQNALAIAVFILLIALLIIWSFYMIVNSIFALYIITLPDLQPMQALRMSKKLVNNRRLRVLADIFIMVVLLFAVSAIIIIGLIFIAAPLAAFAALLLSGIILLVAHTYLFNMYRNLI